MLSVTIEGLWTAQEVADHIDIDRRSVYRMALKSATFPKPTRYVGRTPLWAATEVKAWRKAHPARRRNS